MTGTRTATLLLLLEPATKAQLKAISVRWKRPMAELVRELVEEFVHDYHRPEDEEIPF